MIDRRCDKHKDRKTAPRLCMICARLDVERDIVTMTVDTLLKAGYSLLVMNGEDHLQVTDVREKLLEQLGEVDDEYLMVHPKYEQPSQSIGWVRFVYGNSGYDVISDYTTNLKDILQPVNDFADELSEVNRA